MSKNKKLFLGICIIGLALIVLAGLLGCKATPEEAVPIKVGGTFPLVTATGRAQLAGVEIAFDEANAAGGINGRMIQLTYYNDEANTTKVTANTERLITVDGSVILTGASYSAHAIAANEVIKKYGVPFVSPTGTTDDLDNEPLMFRAAGHTTEITRVMLAQAHKMGFNKIAVAWINAAFGATAIDVVKRDAGKYGLTLVGIEAIDVGATDATVQLSKLRALEPDVLISILYEKELVVMLTGLKTIGWDITVLENTFQIIGFLESVDPRLAEGVYCTDHTDFRKDLAQHLFDAYEKKTGKRWVFGQMVIGYDSGRIIVEALRLANDPDDPASILDAIRKVKIPLAQGTEGTISDYSTKNWGLTADKCQIYQIRDSKPVPVD